MGQKGKIGKQRKDVYYKLAKEKGFRSRAAFKLIQLNRKFQFLENSRVCIDLCAAPGGWLQAASEYMPVSSVIIGVDLVPIAPIRNVITFQGDITTAECSEKIEQNLSSWKADLVLHDGAPNVGKNWLHDSYNQNVLVVNALKIACAHLQKGGCFITKVFRSSDYNSLIWAFGKLFGKVHATKPQASRSESAEIFVVCQYFKCPSQIDERFFNPSALFADISEFDEKLKKQKADLLKPLNKIKKAKAIGYEDDELYQVVDDVKFITCENPLDHLARYHKIKLQNKDILDHEQTNDEIKECCNDLKILGRKELKLLMNWRRKIKQDLISKLMKSINESKVTNDDCEETENLSIFSDNDDIIDDDEDVPQCLDDIVSQDEIDRKKELKRMKRKEEKKTKEYQQRVAYGMVNQGDVLIEEENDLFNLSKVSRKSQLKKIMDVEPDELVENNEQQKEDDIPLFDAKKTAKKVVFAREPNVQYFEIDEDYAESDDDKDSDDEQGPSKHVEDAIIAPKSIIKTTDAKSSLKKLDKNNDRGGGLLTDLQDITTSKIAAANRFFERSNVKNIDLEERFESDLVEKITDKFSMIEDNDNDDVEKNLKNGKKITEAELEKFADSSSEDESDIPAKNGNVKKKLKLDPQGLALATMMVSSDKARRDIEDEGWNRYVHGDSHLAPKWFREDEEKHCRRNIPVNQEMIKEYKQRLREIDAQPIKKVLQAKNRKKRKALRKMEKVKKKVDSITTNEDLTQKERISQIKSVYKNATKTKKQEVKLVVGRKGVPANKPTKGKYKMVDKRMKKDLRAKKRQAGKKGKSSSSSSHGSRARKSKQKQKPKQKGNRTRKAGKKMTGRKVR